MGISAAMSCPEYLSTSQGRRGWLREAKRQLDEERASGGQADPAFSPRSG